jgi:hypothetical protein
VYTKQMVDAKPLYKIKVMQWLQPGTLAEIMA